MAKLIRVETDYRYYEVELTGEQHERYVSSEDGADEVLDEVYDKFELVRDKDGGTEYYIEE